MKIISYNVNGIRSATRKGLFKWINQVKPDIICLQEVKCPDELIDYQSFKELGYHFYLEEAQKRSYSGVAILSLEKSVHATLGAYFEAYQGEGRLIQCDFGRFSVISVYVPSASRSAARYQYKLVWLQQFKDYIQELLKSTPNLIICGDINIAHEPIDLFNPVGNKNNSGFLPAERNWFTEFLELGFVDSFRYLHPNKQEFTWWTLRNDARTRNVGWRLDYQFVSESMADQISRSLILKEAIHSDHCPILLEIK
ncbi:MAG: exodeoxyribonuclease III [bacterium]|nr:exodeoxyribonuclease III [bacterium]